MEPDRFEAQAVVARVALAEGRTDEAQQLARAVWTYLGEHGAEAVEFPALAFVCIADVFSAGDVSESEAVIEAGYGELMQRAARISSTEWRQSFLENVAGNRAIVERRERNKLQLFENFRG
jgi:hypothetical protein